VHSEEGRDLPLKAAERHELRKRSFDASARLYDEFRPGYPEPLFDELAQLSGIPEGGRILEIGPGTGQATLPLARRGFSLLGLELGASMARMCRRNTHEFPNVEILNVAFEDWAGDTSATRSSRRSVDVSPSEAFDMVLAATAFHWIPYKVAYPRCARVLRPSGSLALLWNFVDMPDTRFYRDLQGIYRNIVPRMRLSQPPELRIERQRKKIVNSGLFGPVTILHYPWQSEYTADRYIGLLKTMSDHAILPPKVRQEVFRAIRRLIADNGGSFTRPVVAVLFLAPKRQR
jgi:SAM-dependent methyltransferase